MNSGKRENRKSNHLSEAWIFESIAFIIREMMDEFAN